MILKKACLQMRNYCGGESRGVTEINIYTVDIWQFKLSWEIEISFSYRVFEFLGGISIRDLSEGY